MRLFSVLSVLPLLGVASPASIEQRRAPTHRAPTLLPPAQFSVPITGKVPRRKSRSEALGKRGYDAIVDGTLGDLEFVTNATIGGQHFSLLIDTGSSDTWVPQTGYKCFELNGTETAQSTCAFGSSGFDLDASKTFQPASNLTLVTGYGTRGSVAGPMGYDTVEIGGMCVEHQLIGVPNAVAWQGDGVNSGILGLAFPRLTSAFNTTDPANATLKNNILYDPIFFTAVKEKKVQHPFFSLALDRGTVKQQGIDSFTPNLGFLSFGGIAPVAVTNTSATVPIQGYSRINSTLTPSNSPDAEYFWHAVDIANYEISGGTGLLTGTNNTILDSGTALNNVPADVAAAFAAAFDPPAVLTNVTAALQLYVVDCAATAPELLVHIGGQAFSIDPQDQIVRVAEDAEGNALCVSGTQGTTLANNPNGILLLGDVFFHNVVLTFNPIDGEVTITQRAKY
ncbi:aspartic peptidase domain-containing protein [Mycena filopes]|nr:aspartic peptidase domain-containing protein [Mycena filopes]